MRTLLLAVLVAIALLAAAVGLYEFGWLRPSRSVAARFPVHGIDVSHHQGPIDWQAVGRDGVAFAYVKASEGADWVDPRFRENWQEAGRAGIPRGAYHFFTFCTPGLPQAENFLAVLRAAGGELPPAADVEFTGNCTRWESIEWIRRELAAFLAHVEAGIGRRPILYLTRSSHARIVEGHFPDHGLWVRHVLLVPSQRRYGRWLFWQFAHDGRIAGIGKPVDLNVFHGTPAEFQQLLAAADPAPGVR
jgi:lysozyme